MSQDPSQLEAEMEAEVQEEVEKSKESPKVEAVEARQRPQKGRLEAAKESKRLTLLPSPEKKQSISSGTFN